jgi:carbon monoxide dehydrogenase subunit G
MALTLENEFTVDAGVEQTWALLLDLPRVAGCLPGAVIDQADAEGNYAGTMKVKLGPVAMTYRGVARMTGVDETARAVTFHMQGKETKGQGTASATVRNRLEQTAGATRVHVQTELSVTGRPAQFGRGIMQDVAARMLSDFATCLSQRLVAALIGKDEIVSTSESDAGP